MTRVLLIFIDGLGLGADRECNPLVVIPTPGLRSYLAGASLSARSVGGQRGGAILLSLDACLGVEGLPQSATGQATLFTGVNAPAQLGYHLKGFPNKALKNCCKQKAFSGSSRQLVFAVPLPMPFGLSFLQPWPGESAIFPAPPLPATMPGCPFAPSGCGSGPGPLCRYNQ
jgi:hypothetical protein